MTRPLQPCGTNAGYARHQLRGEDVCDPCRKAHSVYSNQWNRKGPRRPRSEARCGTYAGYLRHWRNKQDACEQCLEAARVYRRGRLKARKAAA